MFLIKVEGELSQEHEVTQDSGLSASGPLFPQCRVFAPMVFAFHGPVSTHLARPVDRGVGLRILQTDVVAVFPGSPVSTAIYPDDGLDVGQAATMGLGRLDRDPSLYKSSV